MPDPRKAPGCHPNNSYGPTLGAGRYYRATPDQKFLLRENADGSILLEPVRIVSEAQAGYNETPELQELITRAAQSETVRRRRERA